MTHTSPSLHRPPGGGFIASTLFAALLLDLLPWQGLALLARPDFVLLVLLYWVVHQPLRMGMGAAWAMGVVMDVADGALLGQHALANTLTIFIALTLHRRIQAFGLWQQALHISIMLLVNQALLLMVHLISGADFIGWHYFLASVSGTLLWPALGLLIPLLLKQKSLPDIGYHPSRNGEK